MFIYCPHPEIDPWDEPTKVSPHCHLRLDSRQSGINIWYAVTQLEKTKNFTNQIMTEISSVNLFVAASTIVY